MSFNEIAFNYESEHVLVKNISQIANYGKTLPELLSQYKQTKQAKAQQYFEIMESILLANINQSPQVPMIVDPKCHQELLINLALRCFKQAAICFDSVVSCCYNIEKFSDYEVGFMICIMAIALSQAKKHLEALALLADAELLVSPMTALYSCLQQQRVNVTKMIQ